VETGLPYQIIDAAAQSKWAKLLWHGMDFWNAIVRANVKEVLAAERPDVVHTNVLAGLSTSVWDAARSVGVPVVHTLRDYYLLCVRSNLAKASGRVCRRRCAGCWLFSAWQRWPSRCPRAVVGISRFVLEKHRAQGFFRNVPADVIYNAVPCEEKPAATPAVKPAGSPLVAVFMGRLEPSKGPQVLLDAVRRLPALKVRVHICGSGPSADRLQAEHIQDRRILFEGQVTGERKRAILSEADVMVVPSVWHEPFGRTVIEGYQMGLAVVASRMGGLPELVEEGVTGRMVDAGDSGQLGGVLEELASAPETLAAMRRRARERAGDFSVEKHVECYLKVYESVRR
jgi:glycosyltransferase involved in cell wall biosynthesis